MEFIDERPERFETSIAQGGANVSGGQKQRLSIARALVKKAPVIIFDDSFSALDFKTDQLLRHAMHKAVEGATLLIVAQRVGTIMNADQILVMDQGKIVARGTHEELLKSSPIYYEIASSQLAKEELARG
jgi:ATP-binding cassette, subfamily B, multidrug efflux pump